VVGGQAEITSPPDAAAIKASVGEMVAYDSLDPQDQFIPCTATALLSANQATVVSAAHCVGNVLGGGHVYAHLKFAPGHTGPTCQKLEQCGTNPFGVFQADPSDVTIEPDVANSQRLDWSFIRFGPESGRTVGQVVPGLAIDFNATDSAWTAIGYPSGDPVNVPGEYQLSYKTCSATSVTQNPSDPGPPGPRQLLMQQGCVGSGMTQGASGGPWLTATEAVGAVNKGYLASLGLLGTHLGNEAQAAFMASNQKTLVVAGHDPITVATTNTAGAKVAYTAPAAAEAGEGQLPVVCTPVSGSLFPIGSTSVTCSAVDSIGLQATSTFAVHVGLPTTVSVGSAPNAGVGVPGVVLTATISPSAATGSVYFFDGPNPIVGCSGGSVHSGSANCVTSFSTAGTHMISAYYSGDLRDVPSIGNLTLDVTASPRFYQIVLGYLIIFARYLHLFGL